MDASVFSALAEPNRLNMVELLRGGPLPVKDISHRLALKQPQTSKHLRVLAEADIVDIVPLAQQRFYRLKPQTFKELEKWVETYRRSAEARLDRLDDYLKQSKEDSDGRRQRPGN